MYPSHCRSLSRLNYLRSNLEHRSPAVRPCLHRGTVQIAGRIRYQASHRILSVGILPVGIRTAESVQRCQHAIGEFKHCSVPGNATGCGSAVKISSGVYEQMRIGICAVQSADEGVHDSLLAGGVHLEQDSETKRTAASRAARRCGSVHISSLIENRRVERVCSVTSSRKAVQHFLTAAHVDLEHRSIAVSAAQPRCAVDISRRIERDATHRAGAVREVGEPIEDGLTAIDADSEYGSAALAVASSTTELRGAVEISGSVLHQSCVGPVAIRPTGEAVDYHLIAGLIHLEYRSMAKRTSVPGCPKQVADGV